ncbi:MAG TPA: ABC-type transport auxiliary lipoprotein family protein [Rhodocyclaceae bacterium]
MPKLLVIAVLLLAGCAANVRQAERATYDLGSVAVAWKPAELAIAGVGVRGPAWLSGPAISYRLLYAGDMERNAYVDSRWAAPPAELIERALNRQPSQSEGGCRLRIDLDELIQVFDTPQSSRTLFDVRASLLSPKGETMLAHRAFSVAPSAPTPDARGGVAAAAAAVRELGGELNAWLAATARARPAIAQRCNALN